MNLHLPNHNALLFARFMRRKLGRLAAWLVTAGMLVYLFSRVPFHEVLEKVGQAAPWTVPALVGIILAV